VNAGRRERGEALREPPEAELGEIIEQATVDAYDETEQTIATPRCRREASIPGAMGVLLTWRPNKLLGPSHST
jgi:hypothetical protein